jgi:hypothetical protein
VSDALSNIRSQAQSALADLYNRADYKLNDGATSLASAPLVSAPAPAPEPSNYPKSARLKQLESEIEDMIAKFADK